MVCYEEIEKYVVMKILLVNYVDDVFYIECFIMEEWVGCRIDNFYVVKVVEFMGFWNFLYYFIEW